MQWQGSGKLAKKTYTVAERLGEGSCGAVRTVYDDEGAVFALKTFEADEDDETLATETLREISALRLLRGKNGHPGILRMLDVIEHDGELCMVMPKYLCNLTEAVEGQAVGKNKLKISHKLLSSVAFMHAQGFMHRDIKGDNVMLTDTMEPVLIDLSLAKPVSSDTAMTHTGNVGTAKYIAPEVYRGEVYSAKADLWSTGVVLLEMFTDQILNVDRDKAALVLVEKVTADLPAAKPSTPFLRAMLEPEHEKRATAMQALSMEPLCSKFSAPEFEKTIAVTPPPTATPDTKDATETGSKRKKRSGSSSSNKKGGGKRKQVKNSSELAARVKEYWQLLDCVETATLDAAVQYAEACATATKVPVHPSHCVLLASKLFEESTHDIDELADGDEDGDVPEGMEEFDKDDYISNEKVIFAACDYCLYAPLRCGE